MLIACLQIYLLIPGQYSCHGFFQAWHNIEWGRRENSGHPELFQASQKHFWSCLWKYTNSQLFLSARNLSCFAGIKYVPSVYSFCDWSFLSWYKNRKLRMTDKNSVKDINKNIILILFNLQQMRLSIQKLYSKDNLIFFFAKTKSSHHENFKNRWKSYVVQVFLCLACFIRI